MGRALHPRVEEGTVALKAGTGCTESELSLLYFSTSSSLLPTLLYSSRSCTTRLRARRAAGGGELRPGAASVAPYLLLPFLARLFSS